MRLLFISTTANTSAIDIARIQATTQLSIGYTIVSCVIPYLRPLVQRYETDGTEYGQDDATFKLSDRSKESNSSGPGAGDVVEGKGKGKAVGPELNDMGQLLGPGLATLKSKEVVKREVLWP